MIWEQRIPKTWRQVKIIALAKSGKDSHLAASYRPVSLLSVCYKLLECIILQRISPAREDLLSVDQAGFHVVDANDICCALQAETFSETQWLWQPILPIFPDTVSCSVWNPARPRLLQVFSTYITTGHAVIWMFTWSTTSVSWCHFRCDPFIQWTPVT